MCCFNGVQIFRMLLVERIGVEKNDNLQGGGGVLIKCHWNVQMILFKESVLASSIYISE